MNHLFAPERPTSHSYRGPTNVSATHMCAIFVYFSFQKSGLEHSKAFCLINAHILYYHIYPLGPDEPLTWLMSGRPGRMKAR